jgi:hypothetical protein
MSTPFRRLALLFLLAAGWLIASAPARAQYAGYGYEYLSSAYSAGVAANDPFGNGGTADYYGYYAQYYAAYGYYSGSLGDRADAQTFCSYGYYFGYYAYAYQAQNYQDNLDYFAYYDSDAYRSMNYYYLGYQYEYYAYVGLV